MSFTLKLEEKIKDLYKKDLKSASVEEIYYGLLNNLKEEQENLKTDSKGRKLYYISAEFLIGKLLVSNLINLGVYDEVKTALKLAGKDLEEVESFEPEPSLGNGGLGRLAACFLDSIASLGLNGDGVGLNYHYGLFKQKFIDNKQTETPDAWITNDSWLTTTNKEYTVTFADTEIKAIKKEIQIPGYENNHCNTLHLFDIEKIANTPTNGIDFDKTKWEDKLTLFLYPDDSDEAGHLLRVYQQYFMVSAAAQMILEELEESGFKINQLSEKVVVQINDTHPSMIIPEFVRLLTKKGLTMDEAIEQVKNTCCYTNHTILAEALEKWPVRYLEKVCPSLMPIIKELDKRVKEKYKSEKLAIIDKDNKVHMAHMDIHYSYSVNGVAALHTDILKASELKEFNDIYPDKFNNKTNGVTYRRWLMACNPQLTKFIDRKIGPSWKNDASKLENLLVYKDDMKTLNELLSIKDTAKENLVKYVYSKDGIKVNKDSIFDIQIKRLHEYKRQQMNALYVIYKYLDIKAGNIPTTPITVFFGGKAAPAYFMAKNIIHLILCMQELISKDEQVNKHLQVVMVENYNVSYAQRLIPACDISEQISLASKEASGTGNMKFMANGAITLGTIDGANLEIRDLVGEDNIFTFGALSDDVIELYKTNGYKPSNYYKKEEIEKLVDFIVSPELMELGDGVLLSHLYRDMKNKDWFMALLDTMEYIKTKEQALKLYENRLQWAKMMLVNIAKSGFFSSDRTIKQYNDDIWKLN